MFPPETSSKISLESLLFLDNSKNFFPHFSSHKFNEKEPSNLAGLNFANKLGLAAGLDKEGKYFGALSSLGFGFIEVGTFTPNAQKGNPRPRIKRLKNENSLINRLGFNNPGIDKGVENIKKYKNNFSGILGVSIGKDKNTELSKAHKDYLYCLGKAFPVADYIAINISSPNTDGLRSLSSESYFERLIYEIMKSKRKLEDRFSKNVPIFLKISPDESIDNLSKLINTSEKEGITGFIVSNTVKGTIRGFTGGISGELIKQKSLDMLKKVKSMVDKDIILISSGGVSTKKDYQERLHNGADLVQIYTGFVYKGPLSIDELLN